MDPAPHTLTPDEVAAIGAHFNDVGKVPIIPGIPGLAFAQVFQERAARVVRLGADLPADYELARWVVRELAGEGFQLRSRAFSEAPPEVQDAIPGGFIARTQVHDLSPEADRLDRLALALANAIPGISREERLALCT